ncbi:hypothetical protein EVAR_8984_1 [Eumeta japonica]|uniref:Uncharacterized protein n=1 Tax=Eumeta variegata TaxID=151549 RepID=A0A4C1WSW2_EUMVA|nr:hypothetical protein EVAR_8984_1 [Eumeta japonica]
MDRCELALIFFEDEPSANSSAPARLRRAAVEHQSVIYLGRAVVPLIELRPFITTLRDVLEAVSRTCRDCLRRGALVCWGTLTRR